MSDKVAWSPAVRWSTVERTGLRWLGPHAWRWQVGLEPFPKKVVGFTRTRRGADRMVARYYRDTRS